jgi:homospermidine synthase
MLLITSKHFSSIVEYPGSTTLDMISNVIDKTNGNKVSNCSCDPGLVKFQVKKNFVAMADIRTQK